MNLQLVQSLNAQNKILCSKQKPNKRCGAFNRNQSFAIKNYNLNYTKLHIPMYLTKIPNYIKKNKSMHM